MAATKIRKWQIENLQIVDADVAAAAAIAISKIAGLNDALDSKEPAFSKNTAFNKNFGTAAGTVSEGNHTHDFGDLTNIPTTLSGFGITDAYTKSESDAITGDLDNLETTDKSNLVAALNELNGVVSDAVKPPLPIDCSGNPDYPAANKGDSYKVSVAGKIGGANGVSVEIGDLLIASVDTPSGDHAAVGSNWGIYQTNLDKATESVFGTGRIATTAEVTAGTNDQAWITPAKLAAKLSGYLQTLSLGANTGEISISGGNSIRLESIKGFSTNFGELTGDGLHATYAGSATGYPTSGGAGILRRRLPTNTTGSFEIWKSTQNDGKLRFNVGTTDGNWKGFETFASEEHVSANYIQVGNASPITSFTGGLDDLNAMSGVSFSYKSSSAPNAPSWANSFGAVLSMVLPNDKRQLWFGRQGQLGIRGGTTDFDEWFQFALKSDIPSLDNYVTTNTNQTINGVKIFTGSDQPLRLQATTLAAYMSFYASDGLARKGYIGFPASSPNDIFINNDSGGLLKIKSGVNGLVYGYGKGDKTVWHAGNLTPVDAAKYVAKEALTGAKDGTNKTFTLANAPVVGKEMIFRNGVLLYEGSGQDYTISGGTVTLTANQPAPVADEVLLGTYIY